MSLEPNQVANNLFSPSGGWMRPEVTQVLGKFPPTMQTFSNSLIFYVCCDLEKIAEHWPEAANESVSL